MSDSIKQSKYAFRAKLPLIFRGAAIAAGIIAVLLIGIGFYWGSFRSEFRMKGLPTKLSKDVVGEVVGYERRESENGVLSYYLKADKATTFSDKHQELENVYLQVFNDGDVDDFDRISSSKAIYIPAGDGSKNFKLFFAGDVDIATRDRLNVKTEQLSYDKSTEIADAEEYVEFSRDNISGNSYGAIVHTQNKTIDLLKDVEIDAFASGAKDDELTKSKIQRAKINAGHAFIDQVAEKINMDGNVAIALTPENNSSGNLTQPTDIKSARATAYFTDKEIRKLDLNGDVFVYQKPTSKNPAWTKTKANRAIATVNKQLEKLELFGSVEIETTQNNSEPTNIRANNAVYIKSTDTFELEDQVEIVTVEDAKPTKINSQRAVYEQTKGKISMYGGAQIVQGTDLIRGDVIKADLNPNRKLKFAVATGNAFLSQKTAERTTEVKAEELNASFGANEKPTKANAIGNGDVAIIPFNSKDYTLFRLFAPKAINLNFRENGTLETLKTDGRTTIKLNAPNNSADAADKTLTADNVKTILRANGNELAKAEASGDAELVVTPIRSSPKNYITTINSQRFDCDFYEKNNAKNCRSTGNSKVIRVPTTSAKEKQTLSAETLDAIFNRGNQDIESFEASGKAKFMEGDRNGIADRISYQAIDEIVRLRGGEPTVWDSQARGKATEIDWDTRGNKSALRSNVSTTYYSQKQTGGAAPFSNVNSPVFVTAGAASFDHDAETALFVGNARAWQENNYVRADRLFLQQKQGQFTADGNVQSLLYDVNRTVAGRQTKTPVFVSSKRMSYQKNLNIIRYEENVDIRQGTDRMVAGVANIFLDKDNELSRTVIENDVVITQPNRRASGDSAEYIASTETVRLTGNPARVKDSENGSSEGREVIVYLKENRIEGSGETKKNSSGRMRTVYKIKNGKLN